MKELSIEEKAKRYDEAIERAKEINREHSKNGFKPSDDVLYIFPELKGSDDEKIRKEIIRIVDIWTNSAPVVNGIPRETLLAWLEKKQGEQPQGKSALEAVKEEKVNNQNCVKLNDKVEPKFKSGDWIIHDKNIKLANSLMLVTGKDNNEYLCKDINGQCSYNIEFIDKDYHLWTIRDAQAGDVLEFGDHGRLVVGIVSYVNKTTGKVDVNCLLLIELEEVFN